MSNPENRIPEDIADEVLALASRYYANYDQSYCAADLVEIGKEVQIPAELIEKAIQEIQAQRRQQEAEKAQQAKQKQLLIKIGAVIATLFLFWVILTYNSLLKLRSQVDATWAQVENQYQRRADLIPILINVTESYSKQSQQLVSLLTQAKTSYLQANTPEAKNIAIEQINSAIATFNQYVVTNPQLQSSQLYTNLQYEIAGTENRIAVERKRYNQAVQVYNQKLASFPMILVSKPLGFEKQSFFTTKDQNK